MEERKVRSNIWKLYVIRVAGSFMLIMPVITLFFKENGLSMQDIFVLQAFFSMSVILLEVPSGYFSDKIGRKKALVIGYLFAIGGFILYSFAYGFWQFVWAEILLGFGASFSSGTDTALLYDSLLEDGNESEYTRIEGRRLSAGLVSEAVASILGGLIALISLRTPLYFEILVLLGALPAVISIVEPKICRLENDNSSNDNIIKSVMDLLGRGNGLKWVIIYSSFIASSTLTMVWMIQPYMKEVEIPIGFFGIIWATLMMISAIVSWNTDKIKDAVGENFIIGTLVLVVAVGYFSVALLWNSWSITFLALFYIVRGVHGPIISSYVNRKVSSSIRATVLSVKNLLARLTFSVTGPFVGWISDVISLRDAIFFSGGIFTLFGVISLSIIYRKKAL